jgi:quinol monooxygenase YgiN
MTENELIRTVRMTLRPDAFEEFRELFDQVSPRIRRTAGCLHLELWCDIRYANVVTTYSRWSSEEALQAYRRSDLFQATWAKTRKMFAAPPLAASHSPLDGGPAREPRLP